MIKTYNTTKELLQKDNIPFFDGFETPLMYLATDDDTQIGQVVYVAKNIDNFIDAPFIELRKMLDQLIASATKHGAIAKNRHKIDSCYALIASMNEIIADTEDFTAFITPDNKVVIQTTVVARKNFEKCYWNLTTVNKKFCDISPAILGKTEL